MIAWTDVESSSLDERTGFLLEVAFVITDDELNEVGHCSTVVRPIVGCSSDYLVDHLFVQMDDVVREMHSKNGLLEQLRAGIGLGPEEAQSMLIGWAQSQSVLLSTVDLDFCLNCKKKQAEHDEVAHIGGQGTEFIPPYCKSEGGKFFSPKQVTQVSQTPFAGSTIGFDRRWLRQHMPRLEALFSYRSIDVSSITELAKRWAPEIYEKRPKAGQAHRALADVRESIAYLKYYRQSGFIGGVPSSPFSKERLAEIAAWAVGGGGA